MSYEGLSLDDLLKKTKANQDWARERVMTLRKDPELREKFTTRRLIKDVFEEAGVEITEYVFDHFIRGTDLEEDPLRVLVNYLWDNNWCSDEYRLKEGLTRHPNALFYALYLFLKAGQQTQRDLRKEALGTYRLWRPSMHFPGKYIMGMLQINVDPESLALRVTETHAYAGDNDTISQGEIFEGCMIEKSRFFFLIARQIPKHRGPPRVTVIHNPHYDDKKGVISAMEGMVTGCYGTKLFSAPVYFERVTDEEAARLPEELAIRDAPALVAAKLQFNLKNNVIFF